MAPRPSGGAKSSIVSCKYEPPRGRGPHSQTRAPRMGWKTERNEQTHRQRAFRGQIGERGTGGAKPVFLEVEPIGPEVHALERGVDADRQRRVAERHQRAIVAQRRVVRQQLGEPAENRADAIELSAGTEIHWMRTTPLSVAAHKKSPPAARSRTAAGMSKGTG